MPGEIRVPELGESVVEVTVQRWLKQPGEAVEAGEPVVELETDKANVEIPADESGVLQSIAKQEGETANVGDVLATIQVGAAAASGPREQAAAASTAAAAQSAPTAGAAHAEAAGTAASAPAAGPVPTSPSARRIAEEHGIDIASVQGSGRNGRITREDVASRIGQGAPPPAAQPGPPPAEAPRPAAPAAPQPTAHPGERRERRERMSRRRQTIARRLVEAQQTAAMLTTFNEADMTSIMDLRKRMGESFQKRHGVKLGFMSFFAKACVAALHEFPYLNAEIQGDEVVVKEYYDLGIAVGAEEGLVVPVVRDADRKSFAEIEREIGDLAVRARESRLSLDEVRGGTFTITNGGIYGSLMSTPILNFPQVGILGMHSIKQRPIVVDGQLEVRPMMYLALSYDHRIVDGSEAVRFLVRVKEMVEDPAALLLGG